MDRNLLYALIFSTLAILLFASPWYQNRFSEDVVPVPETPTAAQGTSPADVPRETPGAAAMAPQSVSADTAVSREILQVNVPGRDQIVLANDLLSVTLDTRGGIITEAAMLAYDGEREGVPAQLVSPGQAWYGGSVTDGSFALPMENLVFSVSERSEISASLTAALSDGRTVTRTYALTGDGYLLHVETSLGGPWADPILNYTWRGPVKDTEQPIRTLRIWPFSMMMAQDAHTYTKVAYKGQGDRVALSGTNQKVNRIYTDELQKVDAGKSRTGGSDRFAGDLTWYASRSKYFMVAAIPDDIGNWSAQSSYPPVSPTKWYDFTLSKPARVGSSTMNLYIGPISYSILKDAGYGLSDVMELAWGFIRPLAIGFLWILTFLKTFIPNWGLVIVAFSAFIKLILYPLTHKSFASMRKMSLLQPKLLELKEKYKNNPQKLHMETMDLYKREGVNPFSSCLPILLQMPVFFALYPVVDRSFELRQALFIPGWIEDLSRPDPFYLLPIAMGVSMFFQMRPTMSDPNQKITLYIMPVIMVILFANFSAGLTLYWFLFNIMSSIQQYYHKPA